MANECAKGATAACEAACTSHVPGRCEALAALVKGGGPAHVARAVKLYDTECTGGSGSACNALRLLHAASHEDGKAVAAYTQGCERHNLTACMNAGSMHFDGTGVPADQSLGVNCFLQGCPSSDPVEPQGCLNLSIAYGQGQGVPKNAELSVAYAQQACDSGVMRGCSRAPLAQVTGVVIRNRCRVESASSRPCRPRRPEFVAHTQPAERVR